MATSFEARTHAFANGLCKTLRPLTVPCDVRPHLGAVLRDPTAVRAAAPILAAPALHGKLGVRPLIGSPARTC